MTSPDRERIETWQQPDGFWRWQWVASKEDREEFETSTLTSFKTFESLSEARESAEEAYPGLPIGPKPPEHGGLSWARVLIVGSLLGFAVARALRGAEEGDG